MLSVKKSTNENLIGQLAKNSNRIVVTRGSEFNPKRKKDNAVIADIRDSDIVDNFAQTLKIDISHKADPGWMTWPEIYINFLENKTLKFSFGVLIDYWIRSSAWEGDYVLLNYKWFHEWLLENEISYFKRDS